MDMNSIDWGSLSGAYGHATEVPTFLRDAASDADDVRAQALDGLFSHVWHQGTVYEVTAVAVPFIAELASGTGKGRVDLLELLRVIWFGQSYNEQHAEFEPAEVLTSEEWKEQTEKERTWVRLAREAVAAEQDRFQRLALDDAQPELIRWMAARIWSLIEPPTGDSLHALIEHSPAYVRAGLVLNGVDSSAQGLGDSPLVATAKAIVALRNGVNEETVQQSLAALAVAPDTVPGWELLPGVHRRGPAMSLLTPVIHQGPRFMNEVFGPLVAMLPSLGEVAANAVASGALFLMLRSGAPFEPAQMHALLQAMVSSNQFWNPDAVTTLSSFGLPTTRELVAELAATAFATSDAMLEQAEALRARQEPV